MVAIIATAHRLHPPARHRAQSVDGNQPSRTAPQPVPLERLPSVRAIPAMVATSTGMAMGLVASDDPSGAAQTGNCDCGGGGCSARGNRPLEGSQVDRRKIDVIPGRVSIFSPFKNGGSPVFQFWAYPSGSMPIVPIAPIGPRASCRARPLRGLCNRDKSVRQTGARSKCGRARAGSSHGQLIGGFTA